MTPEPNTGPLLIAAVDRHLGIARQGRIPWRCDEDRALFRTLTTTHPSSGVIVGRKTWESLPKRRLPGRTLFVVSRHHNDKGAVFASSPLQALELANQQCQRIFIAGGLAIYRALYPYVTEMLISHLDLDAHCDLRLEQAWFDDFEVRESRRHHCADVDFVYRRYARKRPPLAPSPATSHIR